MLYKRRHKHTEICVLQVSPNVLLLPKVIISDGNASSRYTKFLPAPAGLGNMNWDIIFAKYWTEPSDQIVEWRNKRIKCAEVLVPDRVPPEYINGVYVSGPFIKQKLAQSGFEKSVTVNSYIFFR